MDFTARWLARYFTYDGPDFLDGSTAVNLRDKGALGLSSSRCYDSPDFGPDDAIISNIVRERRGFHF